MSSIIYTLIQVIYEARECDQENSGAKGVAPKLQKQVANELGIGNTNYNKLQNRIREPSVKELQQLAKYFDMTVDQVLNFEGELPQEVSMEGKPAFEQINMINQLDEEDKSIVFKIIDHAHQEKIKDFFQKNVAAL